MLFFKSAKATDALWQASTQAIQQAVTATLQVADDPTMTEGRLRSTLRQAADAMAQLARGNDQLRRYHVRNGRRFAVLTGAYALLIVYQLLDALHRAGWLPLP